MVGGMLRDGHHMSTKLRKAKTDVSGTGGVPCVVAHLQQGSEKLHLPLGTREKAVPDAQHNTNQTCNKEAST